MKKQVVIGEGHTKEQNCEYRMIPKSFTAVVVLVLALALNISVIRDLCSAVN